MKNLLNLTVLLTIVVQLNGQNMPFQIQEFEFNSETEGWFSSGIFVKKGDYVAFEVSGSVKLGEWAGLGYATGINDYALFALYTPYKKGANRWNKIGSLKHGALLCKYGDNIITTAKCFEDIKKWSWIPGIDLSWVEDVEFLGNYFVAESNTELKFAINDSKVIDNEGKFKVTVYIIPQQIHFSRNIYNKCPRNEPNREGQQYFDNNNNEWSTKIKEKYYHGGGIQNLYSYNTYRGVSSQVIGCQCVYDEGILMNEGENIGSFDFAYKYYSGVNAHKMHVILDVWPHDIFKEMDENLEYVPTPSINIY